MRSGVALRVRIQGVALSGIWICSREPCSGANALVLNKEAFKQIRNRYEMSGAEVPLRFP